MRKSFILFTILIAVLAVAVITENDDELALGGNNIINEDITISIAASKDLANKD